jgi:hypothetical protein
MVMINPATLAHIEKNLRSACDRLRDAIPMNRVQNEWELAFLIGCIAKDAGLTLKEGSSAYPDATFTVNLDGRTEAVKAELEYRSSRFNHDPAGCDIVICWRMDAAVPGVPCISLEKYLPRLSAETEDLQVDHASFDPDLQSIFMRLEEWLSSKGLMPEGTGVTTKTYTHTFKAILNGKRLSLCSLQYFENHGYVMFKWFKRGLEEARLLPMFEKQLPLMRKTVREHSTAERDPGTEYRFNLMPQDKTRIDQLVSMLDGIVSV